MGIESLEPLDVRLADDQASYVMRQQGDEVARLEPCSRWPTARAIAGDCAWLFDIRKSGRSWMGIAEAQPTGAAVAGYYPRWRAGAALAFADTSYDLRAPHLLRASWRLSDEDRAPIARLHVKSAGFAGGGAEPVRRIELEARCRMIEDLPLVLLFAAWGVLVEPRLGGVGAASG